MNKRKLIEALMCIAIRHRAEYGFLKSTPTMEVRILSTELRMLFWTEL